MNEFDIIKVSWYRSLPQNMNIMNDGNNRKTLEFKSELIEMWLETNQGCQ